MAADDHTKAEHMAKVQIHQHPVNRNEWALSSAQLLRPPYAAATAKSLTTNPKSPRVREPPGMPRNFKHLSTEGSALLLVPKDEGLIIVGLGNKYPVFT